MSTPLASAAPPTTPRHTAYSLQRGAKIDGLQRIERATLPPRGNDVQVRMRAMALNNRDLMVRVSEFDGAADTYRHLATAQHIGKVVIRIGAELPQ